MKPRTKSGVPCILPLKYEGKMYDDCVGIDNGGIPWCYIDEQRNEWDNCETIKRLNDDQGIKLI